MNIVIAHPKLVTFGIGLAITFGIGTAFGTIEHNQAFADPSYGCGEGVVSKLIRSVSRVCYDWYHT